MKLSDACDAYLRDLKARHLRTSSLKNYESLFRSLQAYADEHGLSDLASFDQSRLCAWRESWTLQPSTARLRFTLLKAFFAHATDAEWIKASPMAKLKPPRSRSKPTMPFSREEFRALIAAAARKPKEQALLLLMRFSGLSIRDAVTLRTDAIDGQNNLTLRRAKSGEIVMLYLPDLVITALDRIERPGHKYFFWTGSSTPETTTRYWQSRLKIIAREAGVKDFRTHRLRNTFAVESLLANLPMEELSTLLGHSSVTITERHYAPWYKARRDRLIRITRQMYERDPSMLSFEGCVPKKNNTGAVAAAPVKSSAPIPEEAKLTLVPR